MFTINKFLKLLLDSLECELRCCNDTDCQRLRRHHHRHHDDHHG